MRNNWHKKRSNCKEQRAAQFLLLPLAIPPHQGGLYDVAGVSAIVGNTPTFYPQAVGMERAGMGSWFTWLCLLSCGRIILKHNAGIGGDTTPGMAARFLTDVVAHAPSIVFIGDAHNDFTDGSGIAYSTATNIDYMCKTALANGIQPIIRLITPSNNASNASEIENYNAWLKKYAMDNRLLVVDTYTPVVDSTSATGAWECDIYGRRHSSQCRWRKTHWGSGIVRSGRFADWKVNKERTLVRKRFCKGHQPTHKPAVPHRFYGRRQKADSWIVTGTTTTPETEAGIIGKVQKTVIASGTGRITQDVAVDGTTIRAGDLVKFAGLIKIESAGANLNTNLSLTFPGFASTMWPIVMPPIVGTQLDSWGYFECDGIVPVGATAARCTIESGSGTGTIYMAMPALVNMTLLEA